MCYLTDVILLNETNNHTNVLQSFECDDTQGHAGFGGDGLRFPQQTTHTRHSEISSQRAGLFFNCVCVCVDLWRHTLLLDQRYILILFQLE